MNSIASSLYFQTCLQDEDFNRLGCIFVEFVKHRLMASPTHKRKFEEAFFRRVDLVSGRFVTFLGGVEQALEVSGETRPLCKYLFFTIIQ